MIKGSVIFGTGLAVAAVLLATISMGQSTTQEWLTWQGDSQRSGFAQRERTLTDENISRLELKWRLQLDTQPSVINYYATLTDPLVATDVMTSQGPKNMLFTVGRTDTVYAIDVDSGNVLWQRRFPNAFKPPYPAFTSCPNDLNATPTIDREKSILYVLNSDGKLRGLNLPDGTDRIPATDWVAPYARTWSLNMLDGLIYTAVARGCGNTVANFTAIDLNKPSRPMLRFTTSRGRPAGAWGRGGLVQGAQGLYAQTADGPYDPASGRFGNSVVAISKDLQLQDSFTPLNEAWLNQKDLDFGSASPIIFEFEKWKLVAAAGKEGVVYLLDAENLGGKDHRTPLYASPRYGNDAATFGFTGVWGSVSTYRDAAGQRWLLVPMQGPVAKDAPKFEYTNGPVHNGSVMAFLVKVENDRPVLVPKWVSRDLELPGMPVGTAGGVILAISTGERGRFAAANRAAQEARAVATKLGANAIGDLFQNWNAANSGGQGQKQDEAARRTEFDHAVLYAFDPATGKELYSSGDVLDSWNHYGGIAVANGRVYVTTWDARVYSFGLK
jgi:outer membrane protein assembly factor BamB